MDCERELDRYTRPMIKALETVLSRAATWPKEAQEELARLAREIELSHQDVYRLSDKERAAIEEGVAQADRGEFATDAEMEAFFNRREP